MASASPFNFVPTQEFLEKRKKELDGKFIRLDLNDVRRFVNRILTVKHKTDIGFTFHQQLHDFSVLNKEEATEQMKLWKDMAKDGKINLLEHNNMEYEIDGKTIYTLVVQPKKGDCNFCPHIVTGKQIGRAHV